MRKTWLISDTHFFHANIVEYCNRPVDFTDLILKNWNELVAPDDLVYHLGDVMFRDKEFKDVIEGLPGIKVLIKGNHDTKPYQWYLDRGFAAVCNHIIVDCRTKIRGTFMKYRRILLSHAPMDIPEGVDVNIHGHFHNISIERWEKECNSFSLRMLRILLARLTENHYLFVLENVGYKPLLLSRVIEDDLVLRGY